MPLVRTTRLRCSLSSKWGTILTQAGLRRGNIPKARSISKNVEHNLKKVNRSMYTQHDHMSCEVHGREGCNPNPEGFGRGGAEPW